MRLGLTHYVKHCENYIRTRGELVLPTLYAFNKGTVKVMRGNLERGVTWNAAHSSAPYSRTKTVRLTSWYGIGRYTSALSYRGLWVASL